MKNILQNLERLVAIINDLIKIPRQIYCFVTISSCILPLLEVFSPEKVTKFLNSYCRFINQLFTEYELTKPVQLNVCLMHILT